MLNYIRQNRNVLLVGLGVFMASMTALMFLLNASPQSHGELKANVFAEETTAAHGPEEELNYREILGNTEDPVVIMGLDGTIQYSSDFEKITGNTTEATNGKLFFSLLKPEDMGIFMSAFGKAIQTGEPQMMIGPYHILNKSGEYRVNMGSVYPILDHEKITMIGLATRDISNTVNTPEPSKSFETQESSEKQDNPQQLKTGSHNKKSDSQDVTTDIPKESSTQVTIVTQEVIVTQEASNHQVSSITQETTAHKS